MIGSLRFIGYLQSCSKANESAAFQMLHLIVGVFGGMPPHLVSLRVTLSFYLSCFLEIPSGIVADLVGHARAVSYAFICQAVACFFVLVAVLLGSEGVALLLIVGSCIFSALGGALSSGSFQALIQDLIDLESRKLLAVDRSSFKLKALSLSESHGVWVAAVFPILILGLFFWLEWATPYAVFLLLVPVFGYIALALYIYKLPCCSGKGLQGSQTGTAFVECHEALVKLGRNFLGISMVKRGELLVLSIFLLIGTLLMIHVHTYLIVSQFREMANLSMHVLTVFEMFLVVASFDLAHLVKGWIVPKVSRCYSGWLLIFLSYVSLMALAFLTYTLLGVGFDTLVLVVFVLFFRSTLVLGQNIIQSALLSRLAEQNRATVLSLIQTAVIFLYGTYSIYLTLTGIGSVERIMLEVLFIASIGLIVVLVLACTGRTFTLEFVASIHTNACESRCITSIQEKA